MKKSKLVLLIPAACLLCSCGNSEPGSDFKEIKKEDVPAKAKAIDSKVGGDSFEVPTKLTFTQSATASGEAQEEMGGAKGDQKVIIDTENKYFYASCGGTFASALEKDTTNLEFWAYQDDASLVLATAFGETKAYTKIGSTAISEAYNSFCENFSLDLDSIKDTVKAMVEEISYLVAAVSIDVSVSTPSASGSIEAKFYSKGDGDLKVTAKTSASKSEDSYTAEVTYVIADYLPAYTYSKASGKMSGADFSIEEKSLYEWNKADTSSKPNLKDFTETSEL